MTEIFLIFQKCKQTKKPKISRNSAEKQQSIFQKLPLYGENTPEKKKSSPKNSKILITLFFKDKKISYKSVRKSKSRKSPDNQPKNSKQFLKSWGYMKKEPRKTSPLKRASKQKARQARNKKPKIKY